VRCRAGERLREVGRLARLAVRAAGRRGGARRLGRDHLRAAVCVLGAVARLGIADALIDRVGHAVAVVVVVRTPVLVLELVVVLVFVRTLVDVADAAAAASARTSGAPWPLGLEGSVVKITDDPRACDRARR